MKLNKWNYKTHNYDIVDLPDLYYTTFSNDMDEIVNCPHCGKEIRYGDCYTSLEFHTHYGMGYSVCSECYEKEWERRRGEEKCED